MFSLRPSGACTPCGYHANLLLYMEYAWRTQIMWTRLIKKCLKPGHRLNIDNKLSWKKHITHLCKLLSKNVGIINKLKSSFPSNILLNIHSTLILPYLNYGILAWGNSARNQLDKLLITQKRVMRIICNKNRIAHSNQLFYSNQVLKLHDLFHLRLGCFYVSTNFRGNCHLLLVPCSLKMRDFTITPQDNLPFTIFQC